MLNHITIMGRLTRDPELRRTATGVAVASFTVAVDRDYAEKDKDRETDFIDCVAWRATGEFVSKYFTKGSMIVVSGRLQVRNWTDKEGNKRKNAEVLVDNAYFGESKKSGGNTTSQPQGYGVPNQGYAAPAQNYAPSAPNPGYGVAPNAGGYGGYGYAAPAAPASDFAMLDEDDDAQLPF